MSPEQLSEIRARVARLCANAEGGEPVGAEAAELDRLLAALAEADAARVAEYERVRAARRLAESELDHYRRLLEYGPDGYVVTNQHGVIQEANHAATELLNVSRRFLIGKPLSIFIDHDDLPSFRGRLNRLQVEDRIEWPVRLRPRARPSLEAALAVSAFPESEGAPPALRWFIRDVSARHRAEELATAHEFMKQLLASEQRSRAESESAEHRFRTLAEAGHLLAASLDIRMGLSGVAGLVVPALADLFIADVFTGEALETVALAHANADLGERLRAGWQPPAELAGDHPIAEVARTRQPLLLEGVPADWLRRWAGSEEALGPWRDVGLSAVLVLPLHSHDRWRGVLTFGLGRLRTAWDGADRRLLEDIAQRAALALDTAALFRELEAEHRRKDEFLAMLAHELRNPLAAITSAAEAMQRADVTHRERLEEILRRQLAHLGRLVNDLLDVSRVRFGRVLLHRRRLDLRDLTRHSLDILRASGQTDHHRLTLTVARDAVPVWVDPDRMEQVVANIVDNAIKYTPRGGSIDVVVAEESGHGVVRVRDTGIGIDPGHLRSIFEVFSRVGGEQGSRPGLGLGLAVVRDLVTQHGGSVEAISAGSGRGSEFAIRLPLAETVDAPMAVEAPEVGAGGSILLVEDNQDAREALRILLGLSGFEVETAVAGGEAIEAIRRNPPQVALVDIGLPDMEGHDVARAVRADPRGNGVYLIALTGYGQPVDRQRALQAGFDAHLVKPVDPDALLRILAEAVRGGGPGARAGG
jgi:PAS domain S-box-containing protein